MPQSRPRRFPFSRSGRPDEADRAGTAADDNATDAAVPEAAAATDAADPTPAPAPAPSGSQRRRIRDWMPFLLLRAAHPRQALVTALALAAAAALDGRPARDMALVFATVLVGQVILGWHNDLVDDTVDRAHGRSGKPIADRRLDAGSTWFSLCCAVLLVVPLAVSNGVAAGLSYLASVAVGMVGNVVLRRGLFSFVPWAIAFALYVPFLSYGGWGGGNHGSAPQPAVVALAALIGVGVHFLLALWGLVADNADGWSYLPLRLGLRMGASRLLVVAGAFTAVVVAALALVTSQVGLRR